MKRYELLIWIILGMGLIGGVIIYAKSKASEKTFSNSNIKINPKAELSSSGSPLPTASDEDLVVSLQEFDGHIYELHYDFESKNWQLEFTSNSRPVQIRYISAERIFLFFNIQDYTWDEVDPGLLSHEIKSLIEIDKFILSDAQLADFNRLAEEGTATPCNQDQSVFCATFIAEDFFDYHQVIIYVNKQTRKIDHVLSFTLENSQEPPLSATYIYREVEIQKPAETKIRYL